MPSADALADVAVRERASDSRAAPIAPEETQPLEGAARTQSAVPATPAGPSVRVLSGASIGRTLPITKDELSIGRVGAQVAIVRRTPDGYRLVPLEGAEPPRINGAPVAPEALRCTRATRSRSRACAWSCRPAHEPAGGAALRHSGFRAAANRRPGDLSRSAPAWGSH